jgi:hypothetical protein
MGIPLPISEVPGETPYIQYIATSGQTVFPYPFVITQDSDLVVIYNGAALGTDTGYSLTGQGNDTGGNVVFVAPAVAGDIVTIFRDVPIARLTQFAQNGGFSSAAFNAEFNNIYLILQQLQQSGSLALQVPNSNNPAAVTVLTPAAYANKYLAFDANGNPTPAVLTNSGTVTGSLILSFLSQSVLGGIINPRTAAEVTAGVFPVNTIYPQGFVLRYGTNTTPGSTDMTVALQAALTVGGPVYLPPGVIRVTSNVTISTPGTFIYGSEFGSTITTSSATADVIDVQASDVTLKEFVINSSVTRTAGYYVNVGIAGTQCGNVRIKNVQMIGFFNGVGYLGEGGSVFRLTDCFLNTSVAGGICVNINTTLTSADMVLRDLYILGPPTGAQPAVGVQICQAGDITLDHISTVSAGTGLNIAPQAGQIVQLLIASNCEFDSGSGTGVQFAMASTGSVQLAKLSNVWSCSNANGFVLGSTGQGTLLRSEFSQCTGSSNTANGFLINFSGVTDTVVEGSSFAANNAGFTAVSGVVRFKLIGNIIGSTGEFGDNATGLALLGSNDEFYIAGNDIAENTTPFDIVVPTTGVAGQTWFIKDNWGIITKSEGVVMLTSAATTTAVTHGLPAIPAAQDITLTPITGWGTAGTWWNSAQGASTFIVSTSANPGAGVQFAWKARIWGA